MTGHAVAASGMTAGATTRRWPAELGVATVLSAVILGPALGPGLTLVYDMVFVPDLPFTSRLLGLDGSVPRAVPSDAVVAVLSRVLPVEIMQKLILVSILVAAGLGTARLLRPRGRVASWVGIVVVLWNPYVGSRLLLGQWAILVAYAVLPWVVMLAGRLRTTGDRDRRSRRTVGHLVLLLALGSVSPSGGVLVTATAVLVLGLPPSPGGRWTGLRPGSAALAAGLVVNLPWLLPSLLRPGGLPSAPAAVGAFAARADTSLGTVLSVLTLGGTWNRETTPTGRGGAAVAVVLLGLLLLAAFGVVALGRQRAKVRWWPGLVVAAAGSVLLAIGASVPVLLPVVRWLVVDVPGGALFRDGTRFLPPFVLLFALGAGAGVAELRRRAPSAQLAAAAAALAMLAPVVALTGLAWGGHGALGTEHYPADWSRVRAAVSEHEDGTSVLLLPWAAYRQFTWNADRTLYDPADRWLAASTVGDERLRVGDDVIPAEDPVSTALTPLVESGQPLAAALVAHGVGWVLVERTTPGGSALPASQLAGLVRVYSGPELGLWRVPGTQPRQPSLPGAPAAVAVDALVASLLLYAGWVSVPRRTRPAG